MRRSEHFRSQVFLCQTFSHNKFQSSIKGGFHECHKTSEIDLLQKQTTDDACFHH